MASRVNRSLSDEWLSVEQAHSLTSNLVTFPQVLDGKVLEETNRDVPGGLHGIFRRTCTFEDGMEFTLFISPFHTFLL